MILKILLFLAIFYVVESKNDNCSIELPVCANGVVIPAWKPVNVSKTDKIMRAVVYLIVLLYTFLGVSIIADRFMLSIERITSEEKEVDVVLKTGETARIRVRIWNETVSNLTLMALGSSAPEILLSVIEICGKNFQAGSLGPSTIVGSAAFNLFIIIGICIMIIPNGELRRIKHLPVFIITATFSVVAYLWLYLILGVISKNIIEVWEAVITLLLFPLTVILAYLADRRFFGKFGGKRYRVGSGIRKVGKGKIQNKEEIEAEEFEELRERYIQTLKNLRKEHVDASLPTLESMALQDVFGKSSKSRAFYRLHANRLMTGGGNIMAEGLYKLKSNVQEETENLQNVSLKAQIIHFDPLHYTVMENVKKVTVRVIRSGGYMGSIVKVNYKTEDGTALDGSDYEAKTGELVFPAYTTEATVDIQILDDEYFEEDEYFSIVLSDITVEDGKKEQGYTYELSKTNKATIMILDDDHPGVFSFDKAVTEISESKGMLEITVRRSTGARGSVVVPFKTVDGTAKAGTDYKETVGELHFKNDETLKQIEIPIFDDETYEKSEHFLVLLGEPILTDQSQYIFKSKKKPKQNKTKEEAEFDASQPKLGEWKEIKVTITESIEFKSTVDRCIKRANITAIIGAATWKGQFQSALFVSKEVDDNGNELPPSLMTYILHYLTMLWKLIFACVPPTDYLNGWLCFFVSISAIGILTAFLGDIAASFGCSIGLLDEVTAITFVAVGTSLPDTFASKVAAVQDPNADSSIGNVTGSNAVNVFLGLGVAWTLASIVNAARGVTFYVPSGGLSFSVTIFSVLAVLAIILLIIRRTKRFGGGELGGPAAIKYPCGLILISFFIIYVLLSSLKSYCYIGF